MWDNSGNGATLFEWQRLEAIAKFLLEFELITKSCEGGDVVASEALVTAATFKKQLEERNQLSEDVIIEHAFVTSTKAAWREHLQKSSREALMHFGLLETGQPGGFSCQYRSSGQRVEVLE